MDSSYIIYTDGGARGNPGPAAIGLVIYAASGKEVERYGKYIGTTTNNQAEYRALLVALELVQKFAPDKVVCHLDSELVVRQLQGKYKIKESGLVSLASDVFRLTNKLKQIEFVHVPREKNKLADQLVNEALDGAGF